jgi:putative heme-binding domain-containing protein
MDRALLKVFAFLLLVLGTFLWIGYSVTSLSGGEQKVAAAGAVEISPEGGESIFWGKGRCFTCHSVGGRGRAVRGPNQGQFGERFTAPIGVRAADRARERSEKTGAEYTATDYLVESLATPGAYVVEGYKNEMATVYAPPISLNLNEIKAVVTYLQSQGGDIDLEALDNPSEVTSGFYSKIAAASEAGGGDPDNGAVVFEDNCSECHMVADFGEELGPNLSTIGARGQKFIADSILNPAKEISVGYETFVVVEQDGRQTIGIKTAENDEEVEITKSSGEAVAIAKAAIKEIGQDEQKSVMPDDLSEILTVQEFQDLQAYLLLQKGE